MKKIFTLMAASLVGASSLMAMPVDLQTLSQQEMTVTPEAQQKMRADFANFLVNGAPQGKEVTTRSWQASNGAEWTLMLLMDEVPLCEQLEFIDKETGEPFKYTFEEMPLYQVNAYFQYTPAGKEEATRVGNFYLAWPCVYYHSQPGNTPEDEIDWSAASLSDMCNEQDFIHTFEQTGYIINFDDSNYVESWGILPGDQLGVQCEYDGLVMYSQTGSSIDFLAYDPTEMNIDVDLSASLKQDPAVGTRSGRLSCKYRGTADRVMGFEPTYKHFNNFGEMHIYNAGNISSDELGDDNPFPEMFDELSCLYILCGDSKLRPAQVQDGGAFAINKVGFTWDNLAQNELNFIKGFVFADPKYGTDPSLDPTEIKAQVSNMEWVIDEATEEGYNSVTPKLNSFVDGGYKYAWSQDYGMFVVDNAYYFIPTHESTVAWGTTEGFECNLLDDYRNTLDITSTAKEIYYHYDKDDITKFRMIPAVGTIPSAVEEVKAVENAAKVVARNGMISVNAAEKAPIAVYTLEGKLVKAANAETLNVEAAKGVYVVRVGNQAKKVVL